jgi:Ser/Thr protein kinase RdoA (MazF antagonist)
MNMGVDDHSRILPSPPPAHDLSGGAAAHDLSGGAAAHDLSGGAAAHDLSGGAAALDVVIKVATRVVREWPGGERSTLRLHAVSENATFTVDGPAGRRILRVHRRGYNNPAAIESELTWLDAVRAEAGVRTPAVVAASDGRRVVEGADDGTGRSRSCVMFEHLPGRAPGPDPGTFEDLGRITARLHDHARRWSPPARFTRFRWDLDTTVGPGGRWGRWQHSPGVGPPERALLGRLAAVLRARLGAYGRGEERVGLIHADLRPANLLVEDGGAINVIDFDDCGYGWLLYDLAAALSFIEDDPAGPERIARWLTGYRSIRDLAPDDEAEIWTLILLRRLLLLAWIGTHPVSAEARRLGPGFAAGTCELAEGYLRTHPAPGGHGRT